MYAKQVYIKDNPNRAECRCAERGAGIEAANKAIPAVIIYGMTEKKYVVEAEEEWSGKKCPAVYRWKQS